MEDVAAGMMAPLCPHWYTKGAVPEAEHLSMVEVLSCTVFEVSPESVMRTSEGGAARNMHASKNKALLAEQQVFKHARYIIMTPHAPYLGPATGTIHNQYLLNWTPHRYTFQHH